MKTQKQMMHESSLSPVRRHAAFMEIMNGPNPLTSAEISKLIALRPCEYAFMRAYLGTGVVVQ